ncbi:hypothetical protein [Nocardia niigatensis]
MPRFTFTARDDDTAVVDTRDDLSTSRDEFDAYDGARFHLVAAEGQMRVRVDADDDTGCWAISFGPTSAFDTLPSWPVRVRPSRDGISAVVIVTAPPDTVLHEITA